MSKRISPAIKAQVIAYLEVGFSKAATSRQTGVSLSTVKRIADDPSVKPSKHHAELVAAASDSLHSALSSDFAKKQLASLVVDDLAIAAGLRDEIATLLEQVKGMSPTNLKESGAKARVLSSAATAHKLSTDNLRAILSLTAPSIEVEELPELIVTEMFPEEIAEIRSQQDEEADEMGIIVS